MIILVLIMLGSASEEFLIMVQERAEKGHTWQWVGETQVTNNHIALPSTLQDGTDVFFWEIKE